jgi:hypothetical protein
MTADERRVEMFAAKWFADEHTEEPTDAALAAAFARCVKPPKAVLYPLIRARLTCRDSGCDLRVGDRVMIADQWRYGTTGIIVAVNVAPTHGCVQIRCDDDQSTLEYVLCARIRKVVPA